MTFTRLAGAAALAFVPTVLTATAVLQSAGLPAVDASPEEVTAFFAGHTTQLAV